MMYKTISLAILLMAVSTNGASASAKYSMAKPNAQMQQVLDAHASLLPKPIEILSPTDARLQPTLADAVKKVMQEKDIQMVNQDVATNNITIDGAAGQLKARVYMPANTKKSASLPVILYFHGGGFVIADLDVYDAAPRAMAKMVNAIVISTNYRQAPEDKFPAAHDDAFAAYKWVLANAQNFGGNPKKIAVMGESAGANLAINTAIAARDNYMQMPIYQVLVYPVAGSNMNTESYKENADAKPLNKAMMGWFMKNIIRTAADKTDPRIDLNGHANLKGLPAATIITAQIDPLRSEGQTLAKKLKQAGVNVDVKNYDGMTHEFFGMGAVVKEARQAEKFAADNLKSAFDK